MENNTILEMNLIQANNAILTAPCRAKSKFTMALPSSETERWATERKYLTVIARFVWHGFFRFDGNGFVFVAFRDGRICTTETAD